MEADAGTDFDLALLTAAAAGSGPVGRRRSPGGPITLRRARDDAGRRRPSRARGEHEEAVPGGRARRSRAPWRTGWACTSWIISLFVLHPSLPGSPAAHPRREEKGIGGWVYRGQIASSLHGRRIRGAGSGRWLTSPTMDCAMAAGEAMGG